MALAKRAVSLFFFSGCRPRFTRLAASPLPRACISLTKSEEKERLLSVYENGKKAIDVVTLDLFYKLPSGKHNLVPRPLVDDAEGEIWPNRLIQFF